MTIEREHKRMQRRLRIIPVEAIAPTIVAYEGSERCLLCLVANVLEFVRVDGRRGETTWDDDFEHAQMVRWMQAHPERVHSTYQAALAFVRGKLSN
jgi:hypothetical protein